MNIWNEIIVRNYQFLFPAGVKFFSKFHVYLIICYYEWREWCSDKHIRYFIALTISAHYKYRVERFGGNDSQWWKSDLFTFLASDREITINCRSFGKAEEFCFGRYFYFIYTIYLFYIYLTVKLQIILSISIFSEFIHAIKNYI